MTHIEFFDKTSSENISACLTYAPSRVIYIGDNARLMRKYIERYKRLFRDRGLVTEFLYKTVSKSNLDGAVALLSEIVETYDDCVFDITGGTEILLVALGIVYASHSDKNIQIHRINLRNNSLCDCDEDGVTVYKEMPALSVEENIRIYGGDVAFGNINGISTYRWDMNADFVGDIGHMWDVCKEDVKQWNSQIGAFGAAESLGHISEDGLTTRFSLRSADKRLGRYGELLGEKNRIVKGLLKYGLLTCFDIDQGGNVRISYKNTQVKKCLTKSGLALEMKVFATAATLTDDDGKLIYNDVMNGVVIDWDGELRSEYGSGAYDTENEIDVLMMHGAVPVFVSCKNGAVATDELYKLSTVAERFGGQYAKKVLVATALSKTNVADRYLRQRAADMNIRILEDIQELGEDEFAKKIRNLWNG